MLRSDPHICIIINTYAYVYIYMYPQFPLVGSWDRFQHQTGEDRKGHIHMYMYMHSHTCMYNTSTDTCINSTICVIHLQWTILNGHASHPILYWSLVQVCHLSIMVTVRCTARG